jgi:predicted TIM-barrel fold metal-dependent hydrolase
LGAKYSVISADSHVNPLPTFWRDYLPARFHEGLPRLEETDEVDYVVFEGERKPVGLLSAAAGAAAGKGAKGYKFYGKISETLPGGWDPKARLQEIARDGVDAEILFGGGPLGSRNRELHLASFRAYNHWLSDFCKAAPDNFIGMAFIPMWDVDEAIDELRFAGDHGLRGAVIPAFPPTGTVEGTVMIGERNSGRNYHDPEFDRFWEASVELNLPIQMHLGARRNAMGKDSIMGDATMGALEMAEPITQFVFSGLYQRYPKLRTATVECGVGWFAFVAEYMDFIWEKYRYMTDSPLTEKPSFYMDQAVYGSFLEDSAGVRNRNAPGARNIMWSSDFPHSKTAWPNSRTQIHRLMEGVPESEQQPLLWANAAKLFELS